MIVKLSCVFKSQEYFSFTCPPYAISCININKIYGGIPILHPILSLYKFLILQIIVQVASEILICSVGPPKPNCLVSPLTKFSVFVCAGAFYFGTCSCDLLDEE